MGQKKGKENVNFINRVGEKHQTNEGYEIEIIEYFNKRNCTIRFQNGVIVNNVQHNRILLGTISNPYHPSVFGVGYFGIGKYLSRLDGKKTSEYTKWVNIMRRCYCEKERLKYPTYKDVAVCDEWKDFQKFTQWHEDNWKPHMDNKWHLDKDLLCKECKIYSPNTCVFVPQEVNKLFTFSEKTRGNYPIGVTKVNKKFRAQISDGTGKQIRSILFSSVIDAFEEYKRLKEIRIKEVAEKWKLQITEEVYNILMNYKMTITD